MLATAEQALAAEGAGQVARRLGATPRPVNGDCASSAHTRPPVRIGDPHAVPHDVAAPP